MDAKTVIWAAEPIGSQAAVLHRLRMHMNRLAAENDVAAILLPLAPLHIPLVVQDVDALPGGFGIYTGPGPRLRAAALSRLSCGDLRIRSETAYISVMPEAESAARRALPGLQDLILQEMPGSRLPEAVDADPREDALYLGTWSRQPEAAWADELRHRATELCTRLPLLSGMQLTASLVYTVDAGDAAPGSSAAAAAEPASFGSAVHRWQRLYTAPLRRYLHTT